MNVHERQSRFLWKPLAELAGTDYRLLFLGIAPPPASESEWEAEIRAAGRMMACRP